MIKFLRNLSFQRATLFVLSLTLMTFPSAANAQEYAYYVGHPYMTGKSYKEISQNQGEGVGKYFSKKWVYGSSTSNFSCAVNAQGEKMIINLESKTDSAAPNASEGRNATWESNDGFINLYNTSLMMSEDKDIKISVTFDLKVETNEELAANPAESFLGGGNAGLLMLRVSRLVRKNRGGEMRREGSEKNTSVLKCTISGIATNEKNADPKNGRFFAIYRDWNGIFGKEGNGYGYFISIPEFVNQYFRMHPEIQSDPPSQNMRWTPTVLKTDSYLTSSVRFTTISKGKIEVAIVPNVESTKLRDIPNIMQAKGWTISAGLLEHWFESPAKEANGNVIYDFNMPYVDDGRIGIDFTRKLKTADESYKKLTNRENWMQNKSIGSEILKTYKKQFSKLSPKKKSPFGGNFQVINNDLETFHRQHVQHAKAVTSLWKQYWLKDSDANQGDVLGTYHSFDYYAIPKGNVTYDKAHRVYYVEINQIAVYVIDSFSFNDGEGLGFWKKPNIATHRLGSISGGYVRASDDAFDQYRKINGKGGDFLLFAKPKITTFSPPVRINIEY